MCSTAVGLAVGRPVGFGVRLGVGLGVGLGVRLDKSELIFNDLVTGGLQIDKSFFFLVNITESTH